MRVNGLDHINICTRDLDASAAFYIQLLDLKESPAMRPADQARWLCDHNGNAIIHLLNRDSPNTGTGALHHVALNCTGKETVLARLQNIDAEFSVIDRAETGLCQIFTRDPHGILLELNFPNQ